MGASPSWLFLWVGSGEGLKKGRECMQVWGYKRAEDISWLKTNHDSDGRTRASNVGDGCLEHTTEHCLMGYKGHVKRKTDGHFIHCNIDVDLIIAPEPPEFGSTAKPEELVKMIEHFCLGRRRLHLFANDQTVRRGWLSAGPELSSSNFNRETYQGFFQGNPPAKVKDLPVDLEQRPNGNALVGVWPEIERLRPKVGDPPCRPRACRAGPPPPHARRPLRARASDARRALS